MKTTTQKSLVESKASTQRKKAPKAKKALIKPWAVDSALSLVNALSSEKRTELPSVIKHK